MNVISEKGEYMWDMSPLLKDKKGVEKALKNLHWIEFIKRKPTYGNVFIATQTGNYVIRHNKYADLINQ